MPDNPQRKKLIEQGHTLGLNLAVLQRSPTYSIEAMIRDAIETKKRAENLPEHTQAYLESKTMMHQLQNEKDQEEDNELETGTVVDLSFMVEAHNPADQKYKRFSFLIKCKNELMKALEINTKQVETYRNQLDEDDLLVVTNEIKTIQEQLECVNTELYEIHQWFVDTQAQKQAFYEHFVHSVSDVSGNLTDHFQTKLKNIQNYVNNMQTQIQSAV